MGNNILWATLINWDENEIGELRLLLEWEQITQVNYWGERTLSSMLMSITQTPLPPSVLSHPPQTLPRILCSLPEGSSVVGVNIIWNEELSVLDNRVCYNKLSSRVCQKAKTQTETHQDVSWSLKASTTDIWQVVYLQGKAWGCFLDTHCAVVRWHTQTVSITL